VEYKGLGKDEEEIGQLLDRLGDSLWLGMNPQILRQAEQIPRDLRDRWPALVYSYYTAEKLPPLGEVLQWLEHPDLPVPHKLQIRKVLNCLKAMVEVVPEMEERTNRILLSLKSGGLQEAPTPEALDRYCYSMGAGGSYLDPDELISMSI